jgi:hypothetical protein
VKKIDGLWAQGYGRYYHLAGEGADEVDPSGRQISSDTERRASLRRLCQLPTSEWMQIRPKRHPPRAFAEAMMKAAQG